ncbi:hypothetical protein K450DRAFT_236533 [Umbelopsis ramanniana AG]|uniref:Uncharacterized protein n=1 Tax=Umbelopsis ramanniana AG TaxID=1314678 RepID=A0AAD5EBX3_UMBRA|nr:uncharacterized protein K450DRAFT_236533 [Umbelopsis ramanniana AG]KAI8580629.1 hypothetical protein K450DRAFT_236533 [Umbelopsis ramanniana AG]
MLTLHSHYMQHYCFLSVTLASSSMLYFSSLLPIYFFFVCHRIFFMHQKALQIINTLLAGPHSVCYKKEKRNYDSRREGV